MPLPSVSVVTLANGIETNGSPVIFQFQRNGDTSDSLSVGYSLYGTAKSGTDYQGSTTAAITFSPGSSTATLSLPVLSNELTGPGKTIFAHISPSSFYEAAPGKQNSTATITAKGMQIFASRNALRSAGNHGYNINVSEYPNNSAFAALKDDGSVVTWGDQASGGDSSSVSGRLSSGVTQIFSNSSAFAALKRDGSVVTWGSASSGGDSSSVTDRLRSDVKQIFSNDSAFAALKNDGSVVTWGAFQTEQDLRADNVGNLLSAGVTQICSNFAAFAALKSDGSVVTWGPQLPGIKSSSVSSILSSGVAQIFSSGGAFAALKSDGSVITWGGSSHGGDSSSVSNQLSSGVTQIFSTYSAFAALKSDGSVITWGGDLMEETAAMFEAS